MQSKTWWKEAVIYEIYPRSFKDSDGDGIGDLRGIIEKVDYLAELGVDVIWLGPVYDSPNDDNGYDIRDYYAIHPEFGTMEDFDELLEALHDRGMKLIMDLVVNHSSDEHEWFQQSRKSTDNPYRDFYFWKKGKNGGPPNNWKSFFGGSAWKYDVQTDEYFLHLFTQKQPDLNWENPKVREEVQKIIKFWLDKGIDGFRMDVIPLISKRLDFADTELKDFPEIIEKVYSNGPKVHEYIQEFVADVIQHYDVMTVGEGPGINSKEGILYVGHDRKELNMIFHLDHMFMGFGEEGRFDPVPYDLQDVIQLFKTWDEAMGDSGWISIFLDNHDFIRMVSRYGNDQAYRTESAKLLALMILTKRGTPCIYQGSEIGMTNVQYESLSDFDDIETRNFIQKGLAEGRTAKEILALANQYGRDNARTPVQWSAEPNAGFSDGQAWIKVNPNYSKINVSAELENKEGIFHFYKKLIAYRKAHPTLIYGKYQIIESHHPQLYFYERNGKNENYLIMLNFSNSSQAISIDLNHYKLAISNYGEEKISSQLAPWEARLYIKTN